MNRGMKFLLCAVLLFAGALIGFLLSPAKNGLFFGNHNGNTYYGKDGPEPGGDQDTNGSDGSEDDIPF